MTTFKLAISPADADRCRAYIASTLDAIDAVPEGVPKPHQEAVDLLRKHGDLPDELDYWSDLHVIRDVADDLYEHPDCALGVSGAEVRAYYDRLVDALDLIRYAYMPEWGDVASILDQQRE